MSSLANSSSLNNLATETVIAKQLNAVQQRVAKAAVAAGRQPEDITLIAVSKTKPFSAIQSALNAGQYHFGENYAQELADKAPQTAAATWHFIGPLQSNKTKWVANAADWVHSIDRLKIAQRLSAQRSSELPPLNICMQINISQEPQKAGVTSNQAATLAAQLAELPKLRLRGLMCIPNSADLQAFERMSALFQQLRTEGLALDSLSMGMSQDFEAAIIAGATHVRVGTAIFGARA